MKKFLALVLVVIMALGCCSAFAETKSTEARSNNLTVTVLAYSVTKTEDEDAVANIDARNEVIMTVKNNQDRITQWTVTINNQEVTVADGKTMTITAGDILDKVPATDNATIKVTAKAQGTSGNFYDVPGEVEYTVPVVYAGEDVTDELPTKPATTGDFTVAMTPDSKTYYQGDLITVSATATLSQDLQNAGYSASDVTFKYYVMKVGSKTPAGVKMDSNVDYELVYIGGYDFWAVGTLSTKTAN